MNYKAAKIIFTIDYETEFVYNCNTQQKLNILNKTL